MPEEQRTIRWGHEALQLEILLDDDGSPRLTRLGPPGEPDSGPGTPLPLVEVTAAAGRAAVWSTPASAGGCATGPTTRPATATGTR